MLRNIVSIAVLTIDLLASAAASAKDDVDFRRQVLPIFEGACTDCHGPKKSNGGLRLDGGRVHEGGVSGKAVVPGKPDESYLVQRLLGQGDEDRMPFGEPALPASEIDLIKKWIAQGAKVPPEPSTTFVPAPGGIKRLTVAQYRNTLRDLLGSKVALPKDLEPDTLVSGSAVVGAGRIFISRQATEKFARAAFGLARQAMQDEAWRREWLPCPPEAEGCQSRFLERFGRRAWRRPLSGEESARYLGLARGPGGLTAAMAALLQSPNFLYRVEVGVPDPGDASRRVLTDFEMASRLSYFLWGAPPDEVLLDAAASGRLGTDDGLREEAERMLASPRSRQTISAFFSELLRLGKLERLPQFRSKYQQVSPTLGASMQGETLRVIEEIALSPDRDFREIFDARFTYLNGELARLYGLPVPADEKSFVRVELPADGERAGILGHASFLAINAHPTASSPTKRGRFIRETLLCQPVPPPPPDVSTKLPKDPEGKPSTVREKLAIHRKNPQCYGCHKAMDPMGLAFERFDGIGVHRIEESGLPIDPRGELDGVPFKHAGELAGLLRHSPRVGVCVARNLYRFALGHLESEGEEPLVDDLARGLEQDGYRFLALVLNVVKSKGFRYLAAQ
jgi:mono/diheme cytochrome c family protein